MYFSGYLIELIKSISLFTNISLGVNFNFSHTSVSLNLSSNSLIISSVIFIFASQLSELVYKSSNVTKYVQILAPLIPFMYIDNIVDAILKGLDKQVTVLKINIIDLVSGIFLIIVLIPKFGVWGYVFTIYFSEILNFGLSFYVLARELCGSH